MRGSGQFLTLLSAALFAVSARQTDANLLRNPGFEGVSNVAVAEWSVPSYWAGRLETSTGTDAARSGARGAKLSATEKEKRYWGRILQSPYIGPITGRRFRYSMWAKGTGEFLLGVIEYRPPERYNPNYQYRWQPATTHLTAEWQEVVFEFSVLDPEVCSLAVVAEVRGQGAAALLDDASFGVWQNPEYLLDLPAARGNAMLTTGGSVQVTVILSCKGNPVSKGSVKVLRSSPDGAADSGDIHLDEAGQATIPFEVTETTATGVHTLTIAHPESGSVASVHVDVVDSETFAQFKQVASPVRLEPLPAHLLFIGDSLTDQQRGLNYVDKLLFWLQQTHGNQVTVRNAGVGGDYISCVWQRMQGDPKAYRLNMYENLFIAKPTMVFFFLGHNDSKLSSASNYTQHCVEPDVFEAEYRLAIQKVKQETGARILVLSTTSSVFEICKANADKAQAAGRANSLFGKPEELERYNAIARHVARDLGCEFLDVYEPTRTHPQKPTLFNPNDGVHLTNEGNRFIALQILKHLAPR